MKKPVIMGAVMAPMMMWMLHGALTGSGMSAAALVAFVGAHVALALVAVALVLVGSRMSPRLHGMLSRLHRPSAKHFGAMLASAAVVAVAIHFGIHGLEGASWI